MLTGQLRAGYTFARIRRLSLQTQGKPEPFLKGSVVVVTALICTI